MHTDDKPPAFQFYPKDWLSDINVIRLTSAQRGVYINLLCVCWLEGSIPSDRVAIASLFRDCSEQDAATVAQLFDADPADPAKLIHKRLEKERVKQCQYRKCQSQNGLRGAKVRWRRHGDPNGNAKATPDGKPIATPMAKNGSSFSYKEDEKKVQATPALRSGVALDLSKIELTQWDKDQIKLYHDEPGIVQRVKRHRAEAIAREQGR